MYSVEFNYVCCWNLELDWCVLVVFFVGLVKIINIYMGDFANRYWGWILVVVDYSSQGIRPHNA